MLTDAAAAIKMAVRLPAHERSPTTRRSVPAPLERSHIAQRRFGKLSLLEASELGATSVFIAHVPIDIDGGAIITASITDEAADEVKLAAGQATYAVIKASDVMVGADKRIAQEPSTRLNF